MGDTRDDRGSSFKHEISDKAVENPVIPKLSREKPRNLWYIYYILIIYPSDVSTSVTRTPYPSALGLIMLESNSF